MAYSEEIQNRLNNFAIQYIKRSGDILDRSIHWWHLADEIWPSGAWASGIFEQIKIDGPTTSGYVLTADADGWGTWMPGSNDHATLDNLRWSTAEHIIDADILPEVGSTYDVGSTKFTFAEGWFDDLYATNLYGDGSALTAINFLQLDDTPASYNLWAGSGVRVNATETGLEFCALSGGGGGGGTTLLGAGYSVEFTSADLTVGVLTVSHNLLYKWNMVQIFDNNDVEVIPDGVTLVDLNTLTVDLSSFSPITGTWHAIVACGGGPNSYAGGYSHTQAVALAEWVVEHDLGTEDIVVQVVDSATPNKIIEPQEIEIVDADTVHVIFPSGVTGKARVISTNAVGVSAYGTHDQLSNLEWSVAGHVMDADILPTASGTIRIGSADLPFASGYFDEVYTKQNSLNMGPHRLSVSSEPKLQLNGVDVDSAAMAVANAAAVLAQTAIDQSSSAYALDILGLFHD